MFSTVTVLGGCQRPNEWAGTLRETEKVREREGKCMWPGVPVLIVGIINYSSWTYSWILAIFDVFQPERYMPVNL